MNEKLTAGILLFDNVDVLDFAGPFEVFNGVRLDEERRFADRSPIKIILVAQYAEPVKTFGDMLLAPDCSFEDCPPLDILIVPGGMGERLENHNPMVLEFIRSRAGELKTLASVCTGAFLLAAAGLLDGRSATTHHMSLDRMRESFPKVQVQEWVRYVEDGNVLTSAGISSGIDTALRIVAIHLGEHIARTTARYMEYHYPVDNLRMIEG